MTTAFATTAITTLSSIILKPVITNYLPKNLAEGAGEQVADFLSEQLGEKIGNRFGKEQTMQDKLNNIVQTVFNRLNEKYNYKFSGFLEYCQSNSIDYPTWDDMIKQLKEWRKQKESVTVISDGDIKDFVKEFSAEATSQIEKDDTLNAHLATLRTDTGVKLLLEEFEQLRKQSANYHLPEKGTHINEEVIKMVEENMKKKLENRAEIEGDGITIGEGITQINTGGSLAAPASNVFVVKGNNANIKGVNQRNITYGSGTE